MKLKVHICIILFTILVGCVPNNSSISTPLVATATRQPSSVYQLTYVMPYVLDQKEYQGIFAMDVGCVDKTILCFGSPKLLLKIPTQSGPDPKSPYGLVSGYSWSPDGENIAFCAVGVDESFDIFVSDWNGRNIKNITESPDHDCFPSWSTDNQLVYTVCSGRCHAVISAENGDNIARLPSKSVIGFATWMPDGEQILFVGADDNSVYQIFITNVNGTRINQITYTEENNIVPDASTDGNLIFFTRSQTYVDNNFNYNVFSIDIESKLENAVTVDEDLISGNPAVAPFGNWLAYQQGRGTYDIYVASFDGKEVIQATKSEGDESIPEWRAVTTP